MAIELEVYKMVIELDVYKIFIELDVYKIFTELQFYKMLVELEICKMLKVKKFQSSNIQERKSQSRILLHSGENFSESVEMFNLDLIFMPIIHDRINPGRVIPKILVPPIFFLMQ